MATTLETSGQAKSGGRDYDMWEPGMTRSGTNSGLSQCWQVAIFWVWYQRTYAYRTAWTRSN